MMDFDELLDEIKKENPEDRLTIKLAQLAADIATETISCTALLRGHGGGCCLRYGYQRCYGWF